MSTVTTRRPELGVEFLSWINTELRKQVEHTDTKDERAKNAGLVNRLRAYIVERLSVAV